MNILLLDNYDSFTYNLVHAVEKLSHNRVAVYRNDEIALEEIQKFDKIILSPGPGIPSEAGLLLQVIQEYAASKSILGVCLGHQAIGEAFGAKLVNLDTVHHGVAHPITLTDHLSRLFEGLPETFEVGRYHSWALADEDFPADLQVTARDSRGCIMALQHVDYAIQGVQFHPESILTPFGEKIIKNWLNS
jgi:anthranilate synthase component 2